MKKKYNNNNIFKYKLSLLFILIIIIYCVNGYTIERYYQFYPTINIYPNNFNEVKIVEKYVKEKNQMMNNFIKLTDKSVSYAFQDIVIESREELSQMEELIVPFIIFFKNLFNRARPKQINTNISVFESISANTPAFPSGHTCQAFYLAKKLSIKYPEKREILFELAEKCGQARIYAGLHYPSDHEFSKFLINFL
tara:strand:- start:494 stop:1078 length:585 start_codon:yes stop_codon:yes gene_type:complete